MIGVQLLQRLLGGESLTSEPLLFLSEEFVADVVFVMRVEELALLLLDASELGFLLFAGSRPVAIERFELGQDGGPDPLPLPRGKADLAVVLLDRRFDGLDAVVRLGAFSIDPARADEVLIQAAVPVGSRVDQTAAACSAVQGARQVLEMAP